MAAKNPSRDHTQILSAERERTLASAVRQLAKGIPSMERAFEEVGCTCGPFRQHLRDLEEQHRAESERLKLELEGSELSGQIRDMRKKIFDIDRKEHHMLDAMARQASAFFPVWLLDQVRAGNTGVLDFSNDDLARQYAQVWYAGWRPQSLYKARGTHQNEP